MIPEIVKKKEKEGETINAINGGNGVAVNVNDDKNKAKKKDGCC